MTDTSQMVVTTESSQMAPTPVLDSFAKGVSGLKKKTWGQFFFPLTLGGLTNYIIRHMSKYGYIMSSLLHFPPQLTIHRSTANCHSQTYWACPRALLHYLNPSGDQEPLYLPGRKEHRRRHPHDDAALMHQKLDSQVQCRPLMLPQPKQPITCFFL